MSSSLKPGRWLSVHFSLGSIGKKFSHFQLVLSLVFAVTRALFLATVIEPGLPLLDQGMRCKINTFDLAIY